MTITQYAKLASRLGTQPEAAKALGVSERTIRNRIAGRIPISTEAAIAIRTLTAKRKPKHKPGTPRGAKYHWQE